MKHTLFEKLLAFYLLFFSVGTILFFLIVPDKIEEHLLSGKTYSLTRAAEQLAEYPNVYHCSFSKKDAIQLKELLDSISVSCKLEIWLVNEDGRILMSTKQRYPLSHPLQIDQFEDVANDRSCWITGTFFGMFRQKVLSIIAPVTIAPHTTDFVIIHYPLSQLETEANTLTNICSIILFIIYTLSVLLLLAFYILFYRPLEKTVQASNAYINGNLKFPLTPSTDDEYSVLQTNLQYMAKEINKSGEYQRKFVANISHDFRSPLTSIKGYVEAILDGTIPREMQDKYLEVILNETERLTHLTQNILALNSLNDNGLLLEPSIFDIHAVIHSIAATKEIQLQKKDIQLIFSLCGETQKVYADKEKIQQVIYNLLDNAIKFSDPHSAITITTSRKMKYVFVSVRDNGIGIPPDQIPKIWNRFYKSDISRGKDKQGTGLGLSIVREIIQAHGQNINVVSTEDVGSEFIFSLDRA